MASWRLASEMYFVKADNSRSSVGADAGYESEWPRASFPTGLNIGEENTKTLTEACDDHFLTQSLSCRAAVPSPK